MGETIIFTVPKSNDSAEGNEVVLKVYASSPDELEIDGFGYDGFATVTRESARALGQAMIDWSNGKVSCAAS